MRKSRFFFKNYPPRVSRARETPRTIGWMERIRLFSLRLSRKVRPRAGRRLITIPLLRRNCHYGRDYYHYITNANTTDATAAAASVVVVVVITITAAIPQPPSPTDNEKVTRGSHHEQAEAGSCGAVALSQQRASTHRGLVARLVLHTKSVGKPGVYTTPTTYIVNTQCMRVATNR